MGLAHLAEGPVELAPDRRRYVIAAYGTASSPCRPLFLSRHRCRGGSGHPARPASPCLHPGNACPDKIRTRPRQASASAGGASLLARAQPAPYPPHPIRYSSRAQGPPLQLARCSLKIEQKVVQCQPRPHPRRGGLETGTVVKRITWLSSIAICAALVLAGCGPRGPAEGRRLRRPAREHPGDRDAGPVQALSITESSRPVSGPLAPAWGSEGKAARRLRFHRPVRLRAGHLTGCTTRGDQQRQPEQPDHRDVELSGPGSTWCEPSAGNRPTPRGAPM
jgi:hypothetical protein